MASVIDRFSGDYSFLSNFHVIPRWKTGQLWAYSPLGGGIRVPTVEHGFQAAKASRRDEYLAIVQAETAGEAKKLGRRVVMSEEALALWNRTKDTIMLRLVSMKFNPRHHPLLASLLLETGDAELIEGNNWKDDYWGVVNGRGQNQLGKILMKVRDEIRRIE